MWKPDVGENHEIFFLKQWKRDSNPLYFQATTQGKFQLHNSLDTTKRTLEPDKFSIYNRKVERPKFSIYNRKVATTTYHFPVQPPTMKYKCQMIKPLHILFKSNSDLTLIFIVTFLVN